MLNNNNFHQEHPEYKALLMISQKATSRHLVTLCHLEAASSRRFIIVKADPESNFDGHAKDST